MVKSLLFTEHVQLLQVSPKSEVGEPTVDVVDGPCCPFQCVSHFFDAINSIPHYIDHLCEYKSLPRLVNSAMGLNNIQCGYNPSDFNFPGDHKYNSSQKCTTDTLAQHKKDIS
jgi:hypothetical protein